MENFNEACIVVCFYFIMQFLNAALDLDARSFLGWALIGVAVFNVVGNLTNIFFATLSETWDEYKEKYEDR